MRTRASQGDGSAEIPGMRRKRRHSTTSEVDELAPEGASSQASPPQRSAKRKSKKAKRASVDAGEQLTHELQDAVEHSSDADSDAPLPSSKKVRFSKGPSPLVEVTESAPSQFHNASRTPAGRPVSLSPAVTSRHSRRRSGDRHSLPPALSSPGSVEEHQFSPLREILDPRATRRLRRSHLSEEVNVIEEHKKEDAKRNREVQQLREQVAQLMEDLEVQRQRTIDVYESDEEKEEQVKALETQLAAVRQQLADKEAQESLSNFGTDDLSNDVAMDDTPMSDYEDTTLLETTEAELTPRVHDKAAHPPTIQLTPPTIEQGISSSQATQATLPDPNHEAEIANFEKMITDLHRKLADAHATMNLITVELQNIGFTDMNRPASDVLVALRATFQHAREEIGVLGLPEEDMSQHRNREFLLRLVEYVKDLCTEVDEQKLSISKRVEAEKLLHTANTQLSGELKETEARKNALQKQWHELDKEHDAQAKRIVKLEDELDKAYDVIEERDNTITEMGAHAEELIEEVQDQATSIDRLTAEGKSYRDDNDRLTNHVLKLEADNKETVSNLIDTHAAALDDLNARLDDEKTKRGLAEDESDAKTAEINALQVRIEEVETELDNLRAQLQAAKALANDENEKREGLEDELEDRNTTLKEQLSRIDQLEASLDDMIKQMENLKDLLDSERRQRQAAEQELDERNAQIDELESKLRDAGVTANELRTKLYQAQVDRQKEVDELTRDAADKNEQFQDDMAAEIERRESAERIVMGRDRQIAELESIVEDTEQTVEDLTEEKNGLLAERDATIQDLQSELDRISIEFETFRNEKNAQIESLHNDVASLAAQLSDSSALVQQMEQEALETAQAHNDALQNANDRIATLQDELADAQQSIDTLTDEKLSLETRVGDEAMAMLEQQNYYEDQLAALKRDINIKKDLLESAQRDAEDAALEATTTIRMKDDELQATHHLADNRAADIAALNKKLEDVKNLYRQRVAQDSETIQNILDDKRDTLAKSEIAAKRRADDVNLNLELLDELKGIDVPEAAPQTNGVVVKNKRVTKMKKGRKSKREWGDSGIGMDAELGDEMMEV